MNPKQLHEKQLKNLRCLEKITSQSYIDQENENSN